MMININGEEYKIIRVHPRQGGRVTPSDVANETLSGASVLPVNLDQRRLARESVDADMKAPQRTRRSVSFALPGSGGKNIKEMLTTNHYLMKHRLTTDSRFDENLAQFAKRYHDLRDKIRKPNRRRRYMALSLLFVLLALINLLAYNPVMDAVLNSQLQLAPNNIFTKFAWSSLPIPFEAAFYLFGISNGEEYLQGAKPQMEEFGPFIYQMSRTRTALEWTDDTVVFREAFHFTFVPELSHSLDVRIKTMNVPILAFISFTRYWLERFYVQFLNTFLHNVLVIILQVSGESLVEIRTAKEILAGRELNILKFVDMLLTPLRVLGIPFPDVQYYLNNFGNYRLTNNTFGILPILTGNEFGPFEHWRRAESGHMVNEVIKILGKTEYENYKPPCNRVGGIDPLFYGIHLEQVDSFDIYNEHFCRKIRFEYNDTVWVKGIRARRYRMWPYSFDMRQRQNQCFCYGKRKLAQCDGYTDLSACFGGLPLALSFPHFLNSPILQSQVGGMEPRERQHLSYLDIEPNIGVPVYNLLVFQLSIIAQQIPQFGQLGRVRPTLMPFFWMKWTAELDPVLGTLLIIGSFLLTYGRILSTLGLLNLAAFFFYLALKSPKK